MGQFYTTPEKIFTGGKLVLTKHAPDGVHDVLYFPNEDKYVMFSDKNSCSLISVKGKIENVKNGLQAPYLVRKYDHVLLIAVGGGQAVTTALHYGVKDITAVEISKPRVDLMKNEFAEYSKGLFNDERVTVVSDSGRAFLRNTDKKFDLISVVSPRAQKVVSSLIYEPIGELFSEEAIAAYLSALKDDGILHIELTLSHERNYFIGLKKKLEEMKDNLVLYTYPGQKIVEGIRSREKCIALMYSKKNSLRDFYLANKNKFNFIIYPGAAFTSNKAAIADYFLDNDATRYRRLDKHFMGAYNHQEMQRNLKIILAVLLVLLLLSTIILKEIKPFVFLSLGMGYEFILYSFAIWISLLSVSLFKIIPIAFTVFFLLGSIGYLHSGKMNSRMVAGISLFLSFLFLNIVSLDFFLGNQLPLYVIVPVVSLLAIITAYLITFPFGYLIRTEKSIYRAFAIDYLGSLLALPVMFFLPNLEYLLLLCIIIYLFIGFVIFFRTKT
jgi:hypothetical protein